ncbi:SPX domain-containing membrane protein [Lachnellula suecica]|uniref:SPX domain-containing membrane protein n=1 Tax=Lachnellula suecica TaxID=602035 RepID=A0A8T9BYV0_9HELO|nr:SPX domain-containing membrane protein [Lachnellula suecica]
MKYGQNFEAQSVPQWRAYNVDYNGLKHLIKVHTTRDQGQAVAIPGHADVALQNFEELFFVELREQHDRVELFVTSKADEISRRLRHLEKLTSQLIERCANSGPKPISQKRREKFTKYDNKVIKCGEDIANLQRFVSAQRMSFRKILKKYKKWTGSRSLGERFSHQILSDPKSFTKIDFEPLNSQYNELLAIVRTSTPDVSGPVTPSTSSRRPSMHIPILPSPQAYWNEYDDGSEAEDNDPYTIYVDVDSKFPGSKVIEFVVSHARKPIKKVKSWWSPSQSPAERRPLISTAGYFDDHHNVLDTSGDEDPAYASSSDFPTGYATHYATFPSVNDQRAKRNREKLLFRGCLASFGAAFLLLLISGILVATGRHRLRIEVDAGVTVGVVASFFFAIMGLACMLLRTETIGWLHRICVFVTLFTACFLNAILLVMVAGNTGV